MQGDRQIQNEFTIERGRERDAGAGRSSQSATSSAPQGERQAGPAEFDLGGTTGRQPESGMPERLRRKYYVADASAGDEAKVYADPRGEYLAFKVSTDRMATRLEDAGVVRDMVSIAQHRSWKEIELRGSEEFRRTAWLEASVRGIGTQGYEPDPVDRAALAFRAKPEMRSTRMAQSPQTGGAGASETVNIDGVSTNRPIDVTVMPPESRNSESDTLRGRYETAAPRRWSTGKGAAVSLDWHDRAKAAERPTITIELAASEARASQRLQRDQWQARAERFRMGDMKAIVKDDAVKAARSQLAAIERALAKAVRDPELRRSVLGFAKERMAQELERGREFNRAALQEKTTHRDLQTRLAPASDRKGRVATDVPHRER